MALPHRVAKVTLSGTCFGGQEIWSTGFHLGWENQDATDITPTGVADIGNAWATFFQDLNVQISGFYEFTECKVAMLNNDGKTIPDSAQYFSPAALVKGGGGNQAQAPQVSLVATLANSLPRGLATKGRMFLPGVAPGVDATGHLNTYQVEQIADKLKVFFDTVYNDADLPGNPVLASVGRGPLNMDGAIRNISQIRVGNVYDTQRRRRNALSEAYSIRAVAQQ